MCPFKRMSHNGIKIDILVKRIILRALRYDLCAYYEVIDYGV